MSVTPSYEAVVELARRSQMHQDDRELLAQAVREGLDWLAATYPGRAVEVRVPPFRVVQILGGTSHRRGTPPAVVEMAPHTWLDVITGSVSWEQALASGHIIASGERSDLRDVFLNLS
ncbi:MAG: sterol carrier family protein [Actinomycetes bacterium]